MSIPEPSLILNHKVLVIRVIILCLRKWQMSNNHAEQNDSEPKDISGFTIELLVLENLWRHIVHGANLAFELRLVHLCQVKISDFEVVVLINEDIVRLEIQVDITIVVDVLKSGDELLEESAGELLVVFAGFDDGIEEITMRSAL